ncbi:MAG: hypothetical protein HN356_10215 [Calditrichaeota bacterium]|jgi:hypothetical protein|nr:hypothetical protein [Calditrichota bacterium]MBT7616267.1 hypothetical protein [Calditrichota bacterium]MBT7787893.1 hypothetical protein [Calditrichota bacterium]
MPRRGQKYTMIKQPKRSLKSAIEMARPPLPKPTIDLGDKSKYSRRIKHKKGTKTG